MRGSPSLLPSLPARISPAGFGKDRWRCCCCRASPGCLWNSICCSPRSNDGATPASHSTFISSVFPSPLISLLSAAPPRYPLLCFPQALLDNFSPSLFYYFFFPFRGLSVCDSEWETEAVGCRVCHVKYVSRRKYHQSEITLKSGC